MTSDRTLHMIGNAHLDPVWLWTWQEGFQAAKATFRSALDRMNETPGFVFTSSSAAVYEWIETHDPDLFTEIRERVHEGRWHIAGGWWIQPDCNIPAGESFVRQGLYGQRYFREKLGVTARVGYNVDSFGHAATLPQILQKSGMDAYVFMRPGPHEKDLPAPLFWWEGPDGSRVLAFRITEAYCTGGADLREHVRRCIQSADPASKDFMVFYGVGNHGGGPTRENLHSIMSLDEDPAYPHLVFSTPDRFFEAVRAQTPEALPVVRGDLQHHARGCYSAHSGIKAWNRRAENMLLTAEKFTVLAHRLTGRDGSGNLRRAWKNVLFNQFHDIMGGTSLESAYEDARDLHGEAMAIGARVLNDALQTISWRIALPHEPETTPLVVFNPHPWPVRGIVEAEIGTWPSGAVILDESGEASPAQEVTSQATVNGFRSRVAFSAELPPLGWRTYRVAPRPECRFSTSVQTENHALENEWLRLEIEPDSGAISRLLDKRTGEEVFRGPAALAVSIDDRSDTWSHGITRFDRAVSTFQARRIRVVEHGPVKSVLRVECSHMASRLVQDFTLYPDAARVDVAVTVDWREHFHALKLRFPVNVSGARAVYEIPYGHLERETHGDEEPGQGWIDVSGTSPSGIPAGLSLINDAKYSYSVDESVLSLTVLRSPIYAHHDPYEPDPDSCYSFVDQGIQRFHYTLLPHAGDWRAAGTVNLSAEVNQPPIVVTESGHDGVLPMTASYLRVEPENVLVTVLKRAEEGGGCVLRACECAGRAAQARIILPAWNREIHASFGPSEIKTFYLPDDASRPIQETNLLEEIVNPGELSLRTDG